MLSDALRSVGSQCSMTATSGGQWMAFIRGDSSDRSLMNIAAPSSCPPCVVPQEGSVWPAGGKLIFSAFDRNQSVNALVRTLESANQKRLGPMKIFQACEGMGQDAFHGLRTTTTYHESPSSSFFVPKARLN